MGLQACLIVNSICKCFKFGTSFSSKRIHDSKESFEEVPEKIGSKLFQWFQLLIKHQYDFGDKNFIENNILNEQNRFLRGAVTKICQPTVNNQGCFGRGDLSRLNSHHIFTGHYRRVATAPLIVLFYLHQSKKLTKIWHILSEWTESVVGFVIGCWIWWTRQKCFLYF